MIICFARGTQKRTREIFKRYLTPLQPALPHYYRLKMRALLRAFTHFNQNIKITKIYFYLFFLKKNVRTRRAKMTGTFTGTHFAYP